MTSRRDSCMAFRAEIGCLLDGELSEGRRLEVEAHIAECSTCRQTEDELARFRGAVSNLELPEPPSSKIWAALRSHLRELDGTSSTPAPVGAGRIGILPRWSAGALLIAATFVLGVGLASISPQMLQLLGRRATPPKARATSRAAPPVALAVGDFVRDVVAGSEEQRFWERFSALDSWRDAIGSKLDFEPSVPERLPGGFELKGVKLLKDACCYTLYLRYESAHERLDVFECHDDHPIELGDVEARRKATDGLAYTDLRWSDLGTEGRIVTADGINIVLVGNLGKGVADAVTREFRNAS